MQFVCPRNQLINVYPLVKTFKSNYIYIQKQQQLSSCAIHNSQRNMSVLEHQHNVPPPTYNGEENTPVANRYVAITLFSAVTNSSYKRSLFFSFFFFIFFSSFFLLNQNEFVVYTANDTNYINLLAFRPLRTSTFYAHRFTRMRTVDIPFHANTFLAFSF